MKSIQKKILKNLPLPCHLKKQAEKSLLYQEMEERRSGVLQVHWHSSFLQWTILWNRQRSTSQRSRSRRLRQAAEVLWHCRWRHPVKKESIWIIGGSSVPMVQRGQTVPELLQRLQHIHLPCLWRQQESIVVSFLMRQERVSLLPKQ